MVGSKVFHKHNYKFQSHLKRNGFNYFFTFPGRKGIKLNNAITAFIILHK